MDTQTRGEREMLGRSVCLATWIPCAPASLSPRSQEAEVCARVGSDGPGWRPPGRSKPRDVVPAEAGTSRLWLSVCSSPSRWHLAFQAAPKGEPLLLADDLPANSGCFLHSSADRDWVSEPTGERVKAKGSTQQAAQLFGPRNYHVMCVGVQGVVCIPAFPGS